MPLFTNATELKIIGAAASIAICGGAGTRSSVHAEAKPSVFLVRDRVALATLIAAYELLEQRRILAGAPDPWFRRMRMGGTNCGGHGLGWRSSPSTKP